MGGYKSTKHTYTHAHAHMRTHTRRYWMQLAYDLERENSALRVKLPTAEAEGDDGRLLTEGASDEQSRRSSPTMLRREVEVTRQVFCRCCPPAARTHTCTQGRSCDGGSCSGRAVVRSVQRLADSRPR